MKGGEGGRKKIFVLDFFGCFFRSLQKYGGQGSFRDSRMVRESFKRAT